MQQLRFRRFHKPQFLKRIRRELLVRFLTHFDSARSITLLAPKASEADFFTALSGVLLRPEQLPLETFEALFAIEETSEPEGLLRLERTPEWPRLKQGLLPDSTAEDIAMQIWLAAPQALARAHNGLRLRRLTVFEHAAHEAETRVANVQCSVLSPEKQNLVNKEAAEKPDDAEFKVATAQLSMALDEWFARNQRGAESTRIEIYPMEGDYWFMIRHGDMFNRVAAVERQETEILHFRPERDDVVVYSPGFDELRVNARTKSERDLYIEQFGLHLRGSRDYFSQRQPYTLEPLRRLGRDALDSEGLEGIRQIKLCELEIARNNRLREMITHKADDLFECEGLRAGERSAIPQDGWLARAMFEIQFKALLKAQTVEIRMPNVLKLGRGCDFNAVQNWLCRRGFRTGKAGVSLSK